MSKRLPLDHDCKTRFTGPEYELIRRTAEILDMSESALLRKLALDALLGVARTLPVAANNTSVITA